MSRRRKARPGIARVAIPGVQEHHDRRIGNAERFVIAMRQDRSATITVDADTPEMAEALALDFWKSRRLGGRPTPTIIRRDTLPAPTASAWKLSELQDEIERADQISSESKLARDQLIRKADELGPTEVAAVTGLTKGRIPQIRKA
jgi:hypothetical protein